MFSYKPFDLLKGLKVTRRSPVPVCPCNKHSEPTKECILHEEHVDDGVMFTLKKTCKYSDYEYYDDDVL